MTGQQGSKHSNTKYAYVMVIIRKYSLQTFGDVLRFSFEVNKNFWYTQT